MRRTPTSAPKGQDEDGFTLLELLVVLVILPLIIGGVAAAVIAELQNTSRTDAQGTYVRLANSHDTQITSAYFVRDVQSATSVSTNTSTSLCPTNGSLPQVLGLNWKNGNTAVAVSYGVSSSAPLKLIRRFCQNGAETADSVMSDSVFPASLAVGSVAATNSSASCGSTVSSCAISGTTHYLTATVGCTDGASDVSCADWGATPVIKASTSVSNVSSTGSAATTVTTSSGNTLNTGEHVFIASVGGATVVNGTWTVTVVDPTHFTIPVSNISAYTSGGTVNTVGVSSVDLSVVDNPTTKYSYALTGVPRLASSTASGSPNSNPPTATFVSNGSVSTGNCGLVANGFAAVNDSTGTAVNIGSNGSFDATDLYTTGGAVSGSAGSYPTPVQTGPPIGSPYDKLAEPPTVPAGATYPVITINTANWDPSTLPQPLTPAIYDVTNGIKVTGNNSVKGSNGVLFYVTGGSVTLGGTGSIALSPLNPDWESPTQPSPQVVLWISKSDTGATLTLGGNGGAVTINGAIYAPTTQVTLNGGGNGGQVQTQAMDIGGVTCNGSDSPYLTAGSPLSSGTIGTPSPSAIAIGASDKDSVTVTGVGHLAPSGNITVYECGPFATEPSNDPACTSGTGTQVGSAVALTPNNANGTAAVTSSGFTPTTPGWYCFASYYPGSVSYSASSDTTTDGCFHVTGPPTVVITSPVDGKCYYQNTSKNCDLSWPDQITGTALDLGGPGLQGVTISIQESKNNNHNYWTTTPTAGFTSATPVQLTPTTTDGWLTWSYPFPAANFKDKTTYIIVATATDTNNVTSTATSTFTWNG